MLSFTTTRAVFAAAGLVALTSVAPASAEESAVCAAPQSAATVVTAVPPDYPEFTQELGATGEAWVQVDLLPDGTLQNATIRQSTGNSMLDRAALAATKAAQFKAERKNCVGVAGTYLYIVSFER
jgi:TonB family protein